MSANYRVEFTGEDKVIMLIAGNREVLDAMCDPDGARRVLVALCALNGARSVTDGRNMDPSVWECARRVAVKLDEHEFDFDMVLEWIEDTYEEQKDAQKQ